MPQAKEVKLGLCLGNKLLRRTGRVPGNSMVVCIATNFILFCSILWAGGIRVTTALGAPESVQPRPWGGGGAGADSRSAEGWEVLRGGAVRERSCLHSRTHVYALCIYVLLNACYICVFSNP
jgi:hypothetical protein